MCELKKITTFDLSALNSIQRQAEEMRKLTDPFDIPALKSLQSNLRISALEDIKQQTDLIRSLSSSFDSSLLSESIAATLSVNSVDISNFEEVISETAENSSDLTEFFEKLVAWVDDYIPSDNFFKNLIVTVIVSYFMSV